MYADLLRAAAKRMVGHSRRLFEAEVCARLCGGNAREAERRFGWGRETVAKGEHERRTGMRCLNNVREHGRRRTEDANPKLAEDVRAIVGPRCHADPALRPARVYSTASAREVREALRAKGYAGADLPAERALRDVMNRMGYTLRRVRKGRPLRKTPETDAIFANVAARPGARRGATPAAARWRSRSTRRPRSAWATTCRGGGGNVGPVRTAASRRAWTTTRRPGRSRSRWAS